MADKFYEDIPALANQITNDIDQIEQTLGFIKDVFENFLISFSTTDATVAFPANMELDESPSANVTAYGVKVKLTCGETTGVAFGDVCYMKAADSKMWLIDADASTSMPGIAMACETLAADAVGDFLLLGFARDDTWNWTVGSLIYGTVTGTTGNTLSHTAPSGAGDQVQVLGVATHADRMYFKPSMVLVEI
jgi:hypothetical protein